MKKINLFIVAILCQCPSSLWGQVEGFEESFSGQGDYQSVGKVYEGLDNPAWVMDGNGEITEAGYAFNLRGTESPNTLAEYISRQVFGKGSFLQEIVFKDLVLGESRFGASTTVDLSHWLMAGEAKPRMVVSLDDPQQSGVWRLLLASVEGADVARQSAMVPKAGEYSRLALQYNNDTSLISGYYDFDVTDGLPPIKLELPMATDLLAESETRLTLSTAGLHTSGILHSWSLTPFSSLLGDFSGNGALDVADIDELSAQVRAATNDARFDLNSDSTVDGSDLAVWVRDLKKTYFGDANLDGLFNSQDLVQVYQAGKFESGQPAGWAEGDWDPNGVFNSSDLIAAFHDGGYEAGTRPATVPEPVSQGIVPIVALSVLLELRRRSRLSPRLE